MALEADVNLPAELAPIADPAFDEIVEHFSLTVIDERTRPEDDRITVLLDLPHLEEYRQQSTRELVYGCRFPVAVGDRVLCPPTPLHPKWTAGVVTALSGSQFQGRVKYVKRQKDQDDQDSTGSEEP